MKIFGAGLAGLLAACQFQNAEVYEAQSSDCFNHKALLRFRTNKVGESVGVDFKKVIVNKGIWYNNQFVDPTIQMANWYSSKVIGKIEDRSIWNMQPVERFIAPDDFIQILVEKCKERIFYNTKVDRKTLDDCARNGHHIISTLPIPVINSMLNYDRKGIEFRSKPISVVRYKIKNCDIYQTIYFPNPDARLYRASITGDILIAEFIGDDELTVNDFVCEGFMRALGLDSFQVKEIETKSQNFGKIAPINDAWRKNFMFQLTNCHNIYSLGRFATWRNILLDDVLKDINVIKKLMNSSVYDKSRQIGI